MDDKIRERMQLDCLYEMFRDKIEENVIYIVYSENEGQIDTTLDQLMSISSCSFTGHHFEPKPLSAQSFNSVKACKILDSGNCAIGGHRSPGLAKNLAQVNCNPNNPREDLKCSEKGLKPNQAEEFAEAELDIGESIEKLQISIDDLLMEKKSSHDKASQYLSRKMYPVTSYYSELASQLRKMIEDKTNKLVDLLLERSENSNQIDLHGLNPIQARLVVSELLKTRQNKLMIDKQGEASIDIITGWGKHSVTQGQRVRPTIVALLREKGFEYHHLNKGALRVTIRR